MPHVPNPLEDFATYNYLFTMACATPAEVNSAGYRKKLTNVIFSSAGRFGGQRAETAYGTPELFVDNVEFKCFVTPTPPSGNTAQIKINFEIFEPYSLGLFLQSCQAAALDAGYKSYMDNAPYVIKLEFLGQKSTNEFGSVGPYFFLVRLKNVQFTVNEAGSKYRVETFPYNHQLFNASVNTTFNDISLVGKNAYESLVDNPEKSLITQLTLRELQLVKDKKKNLPDYYAIDFVDCDWGGPNPFGDAKGGDLEFSPTSSGGTEVFKRQGDVVSTDGKVVRGKVTINPKEKTLQFSAGTSITDVINSTILSTKAARTNATDPTKFDDKGYIIWWRLDVDIQLLEYDESTKDYNKVITFRVVPYKIHHTVYPGPEAKAQGVQELKKDITKVYNYIFTGKNTDVLKFDIDIKNLFFTATDPNKQEDSGTQSNPGVSSSVSSETERAEAPEGQSSSSVGGNANSIKPSIKVGNLPFKAGSGQLDTKQKIANEFYVNAITKNKDMINLNIELLGDPFWLPEAGQGNYHPRGNGTQVANGVMNYENRDIYVEVIFRTPIDVRGADGLLAFQDGEEKSPFSGLYKVTEVEHRFSGGLYKCTLKGPRMPAQDVVGGGDLLPVKLGDVQTEKQVPYDPF
jgi:hypothetical protein